MPKPKVKAAVLERSRRATAGKRMASLVGKAQDDDDTFWSHSIWSEAGGGFADKGSRKRRREEEGESSSGSEAEGGSGDEGSVSDGEGSYRMSDEDPDVAVDKFDSDFDESESEDEGDEGDGEEQDLRAEERREAVSKRKKNQRLGVPLKASAGRELMKKKTGKMTRRGPLGEGWNNGLVLNWPPPSGGAAPVVAKPGAAAPMHTQILDSKSTAIPSAQGSASMPVTSQAKPLHSPSKPAIEWAQIAQTRFVPSPSRNLRMGTTFPPAPSAKPALKRQIAATSTERKKKSKNRQFTQEELILESIKSTEMENAKWLSSRKRGKDEAAQLEKATNSKKSTLSHKVSRFRSRRGCSNILTFMDMDHLPAIFTRRHVPPSRSANFGDTSSCGGSPSKRRRLDRSASETSESAQAPDNNRAKCVITGKIARYRDPKTMLGYHDIDAYKEIRRRLEAGELKISQPVRNNHRRTKSSGSNNGASLQLGFSNNTSNTGRSKTYFPFAADQPTMVAKIKLNGPNLKVMVTQGGVPVSPPHTKIHLKLSGKQQPSLAEGSQYGNRKEPPPLPPSVAAQNNGHGKVVVGNSADTNNVPQQVISNQLQPTVELQSRHYQSAQSIEQTQMLLEATRNIDDGNRKEDGVQPQVTGSSSVPDTVASTMLGTKGKVEIANGGSNEKTKSPPITDVSISTTDGSKDDIVPERTTSNGKRTTIEAN